MPNPRLTTANGWVPQVLGWVTVEEGSAELTVASSCVVLTSITHTSTHVARCQVYGHVEVAAVGVPMALALLDEEREGQGKGLLMGHVPRVRGKGSPSATLGPCCRSEFGVGAQGHEGFSTILGPPSEQIVEEG